MSTKYENGHDDDVAQSEYEVLEAFHSALEKVQEDLKKRWALTAPNESELREELYHELLGSLSFERKLKAMLGNGLIKR